MAKECFNGKSNKVCPVCGRKMKCQFIGLQHCKCGMSWKKDVGFFERTSDMVFTLERVKNEKRLSSAPQFDQNRKSQNNNHKTSGEARRRSYGSRLSSLKSGEAKKVSIPIPSPWHISWMIRSFTES